MSAFEMTVEHRHEGLPSSQASCPFCLASQIDFFEIDTEEWAAFCPSCKAIGPHATTLEIAISRWNGVVIHA